jgi:FAD-dependent oxidoreductase domain-containing protein 1
MLRKDHYDVAIVGAGAWGLSTAYHLIEAEPRLSVVVLEARAGPGEGSMGASAAMVRDVFSSTDNRILARNSVAFYRRLMAEHEELRTPSPLLDLYGYLWLLPERVRKEYEALARESRGAIDVQPVSLEDLGTCPGLDPAPSRWYEGDEAEPPEPIAGGLFGRVCGAVAPEMLARFYFEEARRRGVEFAFNSCVQRLSFEGREEILLHDHTHTPFSFQERVNGRLRISRLTLGDGRSVAADQVVVTAGGWAERLLNPLGFATGCSPRSQVLYSVSGPVVEELLGWQPPVDAVDTDRGKSRFPFLILPTGTTLKPIFPQRQMWLGYLDRVARPIGTREDPGRDGRLDYDMGQLGDREGYATDLLPSLTPYLPRFESSGVRLENSWGGYYHMSPDGLPVVLGEPYGVVFAGGDSGSGVLKADSLGRIVAAKCRGKTEAKLFDGQSYSLERLSYAHRSTEEEKIIL